MSNTLEQLEFELEFKLEKNIGIQKYAGKVRKSFLLHRKVDFWQNCKFSNKNDHGGISMKKFEHVNEV